MTIDISVPPRFIGWDPGTDEKGVVSFACADTAAEEAVLKAWALGDYANPPEGCSKCGRHRVCICANGMHRCEKCSWSPEMGAYVQLPYPIG